MLRGARKILHRLALHGETVVDRLRSPRRGIPVLDPFMGYATPGTLVLRGRTVEVPRRAAQQVGASRWRNMRDMAALFATRELAHVPVACGDVETRSDDEGYVSLRVPRPPGLEPGWHHAEVRVAGARPVHVPVLVPVLVPDPDAARIVISDIDDTVIRTGAASRLRTVWTTLAGSVDSRLVFPDAIELLTVLQGQPTGPVFYISSSPWNLHHFLTILFERRGVPRGPMFLRDFGLSASQFIKGTHGEHKGAAIDAILEAVPDLAAVLVGDTGEHDPRIYADAVDRWPGRIEGVILRESRRRRSAPAQAGLERLRTQPVMLHVGEDYHEPITEYAS